MLRGINKVHIIGISGMGTAGLAACLEEAGCRVSGSDTAFRPPMGEFLRRRRIRLMEGYDPAHIEPDVDLFIIGNVVAQNNPEAAAALQSGKPHLSMPQALGDLFLQDKRSLVVCGTHGKTTSSGMLSYLLTRLGAQPGFLVGGIMRNFEVSARVGAGEVFVTEGDEYNSAFFDKRPKFLHYHPKGLLITGIEFDHADMYADVEAIRAQFRALVALAGAAAPAVLCTDLPASRQLQGDFPAGRFITYGLDDPANRPLDFQWGQNASSFVLRREGRDAGLFTVPLLGRHNLLNFLGCALLLEAFGYPLEKSAHAVQGFQGMKRRQEEIYRGGGVSLFDDFAHHPTAVKETIAAFKNAQRFGRLIVIFEPRTASSRRNFFQAEYEQAFSGADLAIIAEVFEKEKIEAGRRLEVKRVVDATNRAGSRALFAADAAEIIRLVERDLQPGDRILALSSGAFGGLYDQLRAMLEKKFGPNQLPNHAAS